VVSEWINDRPETPAMGVRNRRYLSCACSNGLCAHRRGVCHNQEHSNRASTQRFGTEVEVLRGFFGDAEHSAGHRQLSDDAAAHTVQLARAERRLVEVAPAQFLTDSVAVTAVRKTLDDLSNPASSSVLVISFS